VEGTETIDLDQLDFGNNRHYSYDLKISSTWDLENPSTELDLGSSTLSYAVGGSYIVVSTWEGHLRVYRETTIHELELVWAKPVSDYYEDKEIASTPGTYLVSSTPLFWGTNYVVVAINGPADVLVLRLTDGVLIWRHRLNASSRAAIEQTGRIVDNVYYVGVTQLDNHNGGSDVFLGSFHALHLLERLNLWSWSPVDFVSSNSIDKSWSGIPITGKKPTIDIASGVIYLTTGNWSNAPEPFVSCLNSLASLSQSETCHTNYPHVYYNAFVALNLKDGSLLKGRRHSSYLEQYVYCNNVVDNILCDRGLVQHAQFVQDFALDYLPFCKCTDLNARSTSDLDDSTYSKTMGFCTSSTETRWVEEAEVTTGQTYRKAYCGSGTDITLEPVLFIGQRNGVMWALSGVTLQVLWVRHLVPSGPLGGFEGGLALDGRRLYTGHSNSAQKTWLLSNDTVIRCGGWIAVDKLNGDILWETSNPGCYDKSGPPGDPLSNGRSSTSWGIAPVTVIQNEGLLVGSADIVRHPSMGILLHDIYEDGTLVVNVGNNPIKHTVGGWLYVLNITTGFVESSFESGAAIHTACSLDSNHCMWVGQGSNTTMGNYLTGSKLYKFCATPAPISDFVEHTIPEPNPSNDNQNGQPLGSGGSDNDDGLSGDIVEEIPNEHTDSENVEESETENDGEIIEYLIKVNHFFYEGY